jgi:hypothetical protein
VYSGINIDFHSRLVLLQIEKYQEKLQV